MVDWYCDHVLRSEGVATKNFHDSLQTLVVCGSSWFNHHIVVDIAQRLPEITTAALIACCPIDYASFCQKLPVQMLNISINGINQALVSDAQRRGLKVWVYTVDNPEQIQQCLQYQVDGIFTNFPHRSRQVLSAFK